MAILDSTQVHGSLVVDGNLSTEGKILSNTGEEVYHPGHKPTVSEIGAKPANWLPTWNDIQNKPSAYNPTAHTHNDLYYQKSESDNRYKPKEPTTFHLNEKYVGVRTASRKPGQYYEIWDNNIGWADIHSGNIFVEGRYKMYHQGFKPTPSDIGAWSCVAIRLEHADFNTITTGGVYSTVANGSGKNAPTNLDGRLIVLPWNADKWAGQMFFADGGKVYSRVSTNAQATAWTAWAEFYTTQFKPTATDIGALPSNGGRLTGDVIFPNNNKIEWNRNTDFARIHFKNDSDGDTNSYMGFEVGDNGDEYFRFASVNTEWFTIKGDHIRYKNNKVYHEGFKPTWNDIQGKPGNFSPSSHTHDDRYYQKSETDTKIRNINYHSTKRDFVNGTLIKTTIPYTDGTPWFLEMNGNSYGELIPFHVLVQGYCYNGTCINFGGLTSGKFCDSIQAFSLNDNLCFWFPRMAYWQGFNVKVIVAQEGRNENMVEGVQDVAKPSGIQKEVTISISKIYSTFNKPTANDIGALPITGGTVTGNLEAAGGKVIIGSYNYGFMGRTSTGGSDYLAYIDTDNRAHFGYNGRTVKIDSLNILNQNNKRIYHEDFKPTWNDIQGKPGNFTPSSHTHDDRYYQKSEIESKLNKTFQKRGEIIKTTDWNTILEPGCYKVQVGTWGDSSKNGPNTAISSLYTYGLLVVWKSEIQSEDRTVQIYYPHNDSSSNPIMTRMKNSNSWTKWTKLGRGLLPSDIGALSENGGTLNGDLSFNVNNTSSPIKIINNLDNGGWARGLEFFNKNKQIIGSIGMYGSGQSDYKLYMGLGSSSYTNGFNIRQDGIFYGNHKIYHEGFRPTLSWNDIQGKPSSFNPSSHTHSELIVPDTRNSVLNPQEELTSPKLKLDFRTNTSVSLPSGEGSYSGIMSFRPYGSTSDWSGGPAHQIAFTGERRLYVRSGSSTSWGSWYKIYTSGNKPTASELGVVNKAGDTMTGNLEMTSNKLFVGAFNYGFAGRTSDGGIDYLAYIDASNYAHFGYNGRTVKIDSLNILNKNNKRIYHEDFKPTWNDIQGKPSSFTPSSHNHDGRYYPTFKTSINDFNTALTEGQYLVSGNLVNGPLTGTRYGILNVYVSPGSTHNNINNWIWQDFYETNGNRFFRCKINNNGWNNWNRIYDSGVNKPSPAELGAISKTGDKITGTLKFEVGGGNEIEIVNPSAGLQARGMVFKNNYTNNNITGMFGMYMNGQQTVKAFVGTTASPWDGNKSLTVDKDFVRYDNKKIYHEGFKPSWQDVGSRRSMNGVKHYADRITIGSDTNWRRVFRISCHDRSGNGSDTSSANYYDGASISGYLYISNRDYYTGSYEKYPFTFSLLGWGGNRRGDNVELFIREGMPDIIRVIKHGINDYELQVRSHNAWRHLYIEFEEIGQSAVATYQKLNYEDDTASRNVVKNNTNFNRREDTLCWNDIKNKPSSFNPSSHTHNEYITKSPRRLRGVNLNTIYEGGFYSCSHDGTSDKNFPEVSDGYLMVMPWDNGKWSSQMFIEDITGRVYTRTTTNADATGWSAWARSYDTNNKPSLGELGAAASNHTHKSIVSSGAMSPQTGRNQKLGDVYTYNTYGHAGAPTNYTSVIGFGRGELGTVEIAGEWTNGRGLWVRSLRDVENNWWPWTRVYTEAFKPTWNDIQNKPSTFNPVAHTHNDIYYQKGEINQKFEEVKYYTGSNRDFVNGTLIRTSIDYSDGTPWLLEIKGNSYGDLIPFDVKVQGYCYNGTCISYGGIIIGKFCSSISAFSLNGKLCFWFPRMAYWQGFNARAIIAFKDTYFNKVEEIKDVSKPTGIQKEVTINLDKVYSTVSKPSWNDIQGKPGSFNPTTHTHDDRYYQKGEVTNMINGRAGNSLLASPSVYKRFYVDGNANTYYPVLINLGQAGFGYYNVNISRAYNWDAPDTWNTNTHRGGLTLSIEWSGDSAWGGNAKTYRIRHFNESYSTMVAGLQLSVNGLIVWLRGGHALYQLDSETGASATAQVHLEGYTASDKKLYSPRTNTNEVTVEITYRDNLRNGGQVYDMNNRVYSPNNKPTANDVGALPISGGTLTGQLIMAPNIRIIGSHNYGLASYTKEGSVDYLAYIDTDNRAHFGYNGRTVKIDSLNILNQNNKRIYHEDFKPTTSDIGAVNKNGDTMYGNLTFSPISASGSYTKASVFTDKNNVKRSMIVFNPASGSNDPGAIYHETSGVSADNNKGIIHLCPSDDSDNGNDYVTIHGTGQAENIKLFTGGNITNAGETNSNSLVTREYLRFANVGSNRGIFLGGSSTSPHITTTGGDIVLKSANQILISDSNAWDFNSWAGFKYENASKTFYIGGPEGSKFPANGGARPISVNIRNGVSYANLPKIMVGSDVEPIITFGLGDNDTGFNWLSDGHFETKANSQTINKISNDGMRIYKPIMTDKSIRSASMTGCYTETADSYKLNQIWSIGPSYKINDDGSGFGNLYGFTYKHTNNTSGGNMAGGHQAVWCQNGVPKVALGDFLWVANSAIINDGRITVTKDCGTSPDYNSCQIELIAPGGDNKATGIGFHRAGKAAHSLQMRGDFLGIGVHAQGGGLGNFRAGEIHTGKIKGTGASSSWGSIDIYGKKADWTGINFKDANHSFLIHPNGASGVWNNNGSCKWQFNSGGVLENGIIPWSRINGAPSFLLTSGGTINGNLELVHGGQTMTLRDRDFCINGKRALVGFAQNDGNKLHINYSKDFGEGVQMYGNINIAGGALTAENGVDAKFNSIRIPANANLNDYQTPGMYYCPADVDAKTIANVPMGAAFSLLVEAHAGRKQTFTIYWQNEPHTYYRNLYNGTWGPWRNVCTSILGPNNKKWDDYSNGYYNRASFIRGDGVMEIGRYIDFHEWNEDNRDFSVRLESKNGILNSWQDFSANNVWARKYLRINDWYGGGEDGRLYYVENGKRLVTENVSVFEVPTKIKCGTMTVDGGDLYVYQHSITADRDITCGGKFISTIQNNPGRFYAEGRSNNYGWHFADMSGQYADIYAKIYRQQSDMRTKINFHRNNTFVKGINFFPTLEKICKVPIREYTYANDKDKTHKLGFFAQELEAEFPLLVDTAKYNKDDNVILPKDKDGNDIKDLKSIDNTGISAVLWDGMKELVEQNSLQQKEIQNLKSEIESLKNTLLNLIEKNQVKIDIK